MREVVMKKVIEHQIEMLKGHIKVYEQRGNQAAIEHAQKLIREYEEQLKKFK